MTDQADDTPLRPCPFCGGDVTLVPRDKLHVFKCPDGSPCLGVGFATYAKSDQLESAIAAWNTRADEAAKWKAMAGKLAELVRRATYNTDPLYITWHSLAAEALREYKEARDGGTS